MLTEEQITKFQAIYKKRFKKDISRADVLERGTKLLRLIEIIYKPMTMAEFERLQKRRRETGDL